MSGRIIQFALFLGTVLFVAGAVHFYLYTTLVRDTGLAAPWRRAAAIAIIALGASLPLSFLLVRFAPFYVGRWLLTVPYVWMGAVFILFLFVAAPNLVRVSCELARKFWGLAPIDPATLRLVARVVAVFALAGTLGLLCVGIWGATRRATVLEIEIALSKLPRELSGFRIAQISDLHLGGTLGRSWLERIVSQVNGLEPDLIAVTGDLVDASPARILSEVEPISRLRAPHGVFFVTGNHEYYSGVEEWMKALTQLGVRVLRNEHVLISRGRAAFALSGVDDFSAQGMAAGHGADLDRALKGLDETTEVVLLAHQPRASEGAAKRDVGLILSGHTHGGQFWPFTPFVTLQQPFRGGLHTVGQRTQIYVSEGTGYWGPPLRIGTRSEIALFRLVAAP